MSSRQISTFGFNKSRVKQMVFNPLEGQIHTGKMMKNLLLLATQLGVEVITGAEVLAFEEKSHGVEIALDGGLKFTAEKVAFVPMPLLNCFCRMWNWCQVVERYSLQSPLKTCLLWYISL